MDIEKELEDLQSSEEEIDDDLSLYSKIKGKKKSKKNDKLDYQIRKALDAHEDSQSELDFIEDYINNGKKKKKRLNDGDIFSGGDENKKIKNIEAKFKPELANLVKLLKENEATSKLINEIIIPMVKNKSSRVTYKGLTDLLAALNTANSNRLSTIREIGSIKKSIIDLKIKSKKDEPNNNDLPMDQFGSRIFEELFREGRSNVVAKANEYQNINNYALPDSAKSFDEICEERLSTENNRYRSEEGSKVIEYESRNPELCIRKSFSTGDMDIVAIDSDGVIIEDYPVPDINTLGTININPDTNTATDMTGRSFKVIDIA